MIICENGGYFSGCSSFAVVQFGLVCGLCVGLLVLVVTVTFHAGFFCNSRK